MQCVFLFSRLFPLLLPALCTTMVAPSNLSIPAAITLYHIWVRLPFMIKVTVDVIEETVRV